MNHATIKGWKLNKQAKSNSVFSICFVQKIKSNIFRVLSFSISKNERIINNYSIAINVSALFILLFEKKSSSESDDKITELSWRVKEELKYSFQIRNLLASHTRVSSHLYMTVSAQQDSFNLFESSLKQEP